MKSRDKLFLIGLFLVAGNFSGHVTDFGANCGLGLMIFSLALDFLEIRWKSDYKTNTRNMTKPKEGKMTKLTKAQEKKLQKLLTKFAYGCIKTGWRPNGEDIEQFINSLLSKQKKEIEKVFMEKISHKLHTIRASIPLTYGRNARKMIKELLNELYPKQTKETK